MISWTEVTLSIRCTYGLYLKTDDANGGLVTAPKQWTDVSQQEKFISVLFVFSSNDTATESSLTKTSILLRCNWMVDMWSEWVMKLVKRSEKEVMGCGGEALDLNHSS